MPNLETLFPACSARPGRTHQEFQFSRYILSRNGSPFQVRRAEVGDSLRVRDLHSPGPELLLSAPKKITEREFLRAAVCLLG
jgi:hypothetical protein